MTGMDIGIVVANYDRTEGTGGYTVELLTRIAPHHSVTLYASGVLTEPPPGVRVVNVPALRRRAYATILSFPAAFALVRRGHDLVHAQGWTAFSADVVTAHYVMAAWRRLARNRGVRSAPGERIFGGVVTSQEARLFRRCRALIAPSRGVRDDVAKYYGRTGEIDVIYHGFSQPATAIPRDEARRRLGISANLILALYIGDARKGLEAALRATANVPAIHLLVVTRTQQDGYRSALAAPELSGRVHWAGFLKDPAPAYAAADLFLYPTIYDPFGLVIAEAMAHGIPPIVPRSAGAAELLVHGASGWLLDRPDAEDATSGLRALAGDPALRGRLSSGARAVAARRTWDDVARETLAVYERTARDRRR